MVAGTELPINHNANATQMAQEIFGDGVSVVGASYSGDYRSSGIYSNGDSIAPGVTPSDTGVILSTGRVWDFTNHSGQSNQSSGRGTNTQGESNNPQFNQAAGSNTYDASYLDVDFIPTGDVMTMQFVFASEEYPEYTNSVYQDFVGVWINGVQVEMSVGNGDADPGNINATNNENLFVDNTNDQYNTEMDGFTVTMTLTLPVHPNVVNSIRIGIADVSDSGYDSNLLIAGDSVQSDLVAIDDTTSLTGAQTKTINVLSNDQAQAALTITHINGVAVSVGDTVTLNTGQTVTLNANGTLTMVGDGTDEDFNFTYGMTDGTNADTGLVHVSSVPCFVRGTWIATPDGDRLIEDLVAGDLVNTYDNGAQPIRWIGARTVPATAQFAPIEIAPNTFGTHGRLMLSPQHRVLIRDYLAELLFGETEVLIAAKDLVNEYSVRRIEGGEVTYLHMLFDSHQIVFSQGLATESFLPGPQTEKSFEAEIVEEIFALFPELDRGTCHGYGPTARLSLKRYEAQTLLAGAAA